MENEYSENKLTRLLKVIFWIMIAVVCIGYIILQTTRRDPFSNRDAQLTDLSEGAVLIDENGERTPLAIVDGYFVYPQAQAGEVIKIALPLPQITRNDMCISVFATEQDIGIYIDGELRESYNDEAYRLAGSYSASRFVVTGLSVEDSGKELLVTYHTTLADYAGALCCPTFSPWKNLFSWIIFRYLGQVVSAVLLTTVGTIFILFWILRRYHHRNGKGVCYLGVFSMTMGLWLLCQSNMRCLYSSYLSATNLMTFLALMIAPVPMLMFFNELMLHVYQRRFNVMIIFAMVNIAGNVLFEVLGICNMIEILATTHLIIVTASILCLVTFLDFMKRNVITSPKYVLIGLIGFIIVTFVEDMNLLFFNFFFVGKYLGYGLLFFLVMLGYAAIQSLEVQEREYRSALHASKVKSTFLANMSHEIRTPINTILGMDEMILRESEDAEITHYAENIRNAGEILLSLINDILDYTKIESGKEEPVFVRYELRKLLEDLIHTVDIKAQEKNLQLKIEVEEEIPNVLYGDELRIKQAAANILTNAVKYTDKGSISLRVRYIRISEEEIRLYLIVEDTGIGIRKEDQERLFDSFVRLEEERNRSIEGTGLGLAITKQLVECMKGSLNLVSEYGKGSSFTISLVQKVLVNRPIGRFESRLTPVRAGHTKHYTEQYCAKDMHLLVVDDNKMNLEVIKGLLGKTGAVIDIANSGEECLARLEEETYDLIFLDHMMPGMDGIETMRRIQANTKRGVPRIPVVALTANAVSGARAEYIRYGFADYIAKPVEYHRLIEVLSKFLPDKLTRKEGIEQELTSDWRMLEEAGIYAQEALRYAGDDPAQYEHLLKIFVSEAEQEKQQLLWQAYQQKNWKDYTTYVHGLKNCAKLIGADSLSRMAYGHELYGKEQDEANLTREKLDKLTALWQETIEIVRSYLQHNGQEINTTGQEEQQQDAQEWEDKEELEQSVKEVIRYLDTFQKKEALMQLTKLLDKCPTGEKRAKIEQAVLAVQGYEYERAIVLLEEM